VGNDLARGREPDAATKIAAGTSPSPFLLQEEQAHGCPRPGAQKQAHWNPREQLEAAASRGHDREIEQWLFDWPLGVQSQYDVS